MHSHTIAHSKTLAFCSPLPVTAPRCHVARTTTRRVPILSVATPPKRIASVAKDLQTALQDSLRARQSRIDITLPSGAKLGTEQRRDEQDLPSRQLAGDRELARIIAAMFENTGLSVNVIFPSLAAKSAAVKMWGPLVQCTFSHWDSSNTAKKNVSREKTKKKKGKSSGFGKDLGKDESKNQADVFVIAGPVAGMMPRVRAVSEAMGQDKLIIVLNANSGRQQMPVDVEKYMSDVFEEVYHYSPNPHPKWSGGVLFRKFPDDWVLCRLTGIGMLQKLIVQTEKPSLEQIEQALGTEEKMPGNAFMKKISSFIDQTDS